MRSGHRIVKWFKASRQWWIGIVHFFAACRTARNSNFSAVRGSFLSAFPRKVTHRRYWKLSPDQGVDKIDDIASVQIDMSSFGEIGDAPKFDSRNEETADHSMPYLVVRTLIDGDIFLNSITERAIHGSDGRAYGQPLFTSACPDFLRTVRRTPRRSGFSRMTRMTLQEVNKKLIACCAYKHVTNQRRDLVRAQWSNLRAVKDIAEAVQTIAKFSQPKPLFLDQAREQVV